MQEQFHQYKECTLFFAAVADACSLEAVAGYSVIPTEPGTPHHQV